MARTLPRYNQAQQLEADRRKLNKILRAVGADESEPADRRHRYTATTAGDAGKLRGLPCIGNGVSGHIPGTQPMSYVLGREARRQRRRQGP